MSILRYLSAGNIRLRFLSSHVQETVWTHSVKFYTDPLNSLLIPQRVTEQEKHT